MRSTIVYLAAEAEVDEATREFEQGFQRMEGATKKVGAQAGATSSAFASLKSAISTVATIEAIRRTAMMAHELAVLSDQAGITRDTFERLATRAGTVGDVELQALRRATQGTVSDLDLMRRVGAAVDAGLTFEQARIAIEYLSRYSRAFGKDMDQLLQTVFTGLQRGSPQFLDDVGIIISAQGAWLEGLSDVEKKSAIVNAAIEDMVRRTRMLPDATEGAAIATDRLAAAWENLKVASGSWVEAPVTVVLEAVTEAITGMNEALAEAGQPRQDPVSQARLRPWQELKDVVAEIAIHADRLAGLGNLNVPEMRQFTIRSGAAAMPETVVSARRALAPSPGLHTAHQPDVAIERIEAIGKALEPFVRLDIASQFSLWGEGMQEMYDALQEPKALKAAQEWEAELQKVAAAATAATATQKRYADDNALKIVRAAAQRQADYNRVLEESSGVLGRLAPEFRGFFDAMVDMAQGDYIGAVFNAIHGLLDVFGIARDSTDRLADAVHRYEQATREAAQARQSILSRLSGSSGEWEALVRGQTAPLKEYLDSLMKSITETVVQEDEFGRPMPKTVTTPGLSQFEAVTKLINEASTGGSGGLAQYFAQSGQSLLQFKQSLNYTFGPDSTLLDAVESMLDASGAFDDVSTAAAKLAGTLDPARRALEAQADVQEMALRTQAVSRFQGAGDIYQQRQIFQDLTNQIAAMRQSRETALAGLGYTTTRSAAAKAVADSGVTGAGGGTSGVTDPYSFTPIRVPWHETVEMYADPLRGPKPAGWWEVVYTGEWNPMARWWWKAVKMLADPANSPAPAGWWEVVWTGDWKKMDRWWWKTVNMLADPANSPAPTAWSDVVSLPETLQKIPVSWDRAVTFRESALAPWQTQAYSSLRNYLGMAAVSAMSNPIALDIGRLYRVQGNLTLDITPYINISSSAFRDAIAAAVNRALQDRTVGSSTSLKQGAGYTFAY